MRISGRNRGRARGLQNQRPARSGTTSEADSKTVALSTLADVVGETSTSRPPPDAVFEQLTAVGEGSAAGPLVISEKKEDARESIEIGVNGPAAQAHPAAQHELQGCIDKATWTSIEGWVWDPKNPKARIQLELVEGDVQLATTVANIARPDLLPAQIGDGRHGFTIDLPPQRLSEGRHTVHLRCVKTGAAVPGSPMILAPWLDARKAAFRWHIDEITDKAASGWIAPTIGPLHHCTVALKEGGAVLARAVASQFRADLLSAGIGDGCYAFTLPMPHSLLDGNLHLLEIIEEQTGAAVTEQPIPWRSGAGTAGTALTGIGGKTASASADSLARRPRTTRPPLTARADFDELRISSVDSGVASSGVTRVLFDISDLVYYIGEHRHLTGIQRVQSSIVLAMIEAEVLAPSSVVFLSFNTRTGNWLTIPTGFLVSLLRDLLLPEEQRMINFPAEEARYGILRGVQPFDGTGVLDDGNPSVLCLLGAGWAHQDYMHRVLTWKRRFGTRFVMMVHDMIPIYARETCHEGTARVFVDFMQSAMRHVDHILAVSDNTAKDVRRFLATLQLPAPAITVTKNGSSFAEFIRRGEKPGKATPADLPKRFVLFVATIEGRKNHKLIFDVWRRMIEQGDDPPHLVCVGKLGWKATEFVSSLVETNYLDGRVQLLREVSDTDLCMLYERCMFTVCPTLYEGWGLPVSESLAMGKVCVCSDRASVPEVAGSCGVYINIDRPDEAVQVIRDLIQGEKHRRELEAKIRRDYVPITWRSVAERVVAACEASTAVKWQDPYPYVTLPYSTEVSFGQLDRDTDGTGEAVLSRILDERRSHFNFESLDRQSFDLGEAIRSAGIWAQPERWGTWLCHSGGDVAFCLAPDTNPVDVVWVWLRLRVCSLLHEQPVRLLANGERLWEGQIGSNSRDIMLRVRKRAGANSHSRVRLGVEVDVSPETRNQIAALDGRVPTIGFERLIVVAGNDLVGRLDVLSKFAMSRQ